MFVEYRSFHLPIPSVIYTVLSYCRLDKCEKNYAQARKQSSKSHLPFEL